MFKIPHLFKINIMPLRLLYAAIVIVGIVLAYKSLSLMGTMAMLGEATLGNSIGRNDAPYTIIEFVDYTCTYCREVHTTVKSLVENHNDIRVVYRHLPVHGTESFPAIQLALAAGIQGRFEDVHNRIMEEYEEVDEHYINNIVEEFGLNSDQLHNDLKGQKIGVFLLETVDAAKRLGVTVTPMFLVGDLLYKPDSGLPTEDDFLNVLEQAYKKKSSKK